MGNMNPQRETVEVVWLGQVDYRAAWDLQNRLAAEIADGKQAPILLLLEHPHTFTIGRRGGRDHLVWDEKKRAQAGVALVEVDRGGDITYHGPGQLVGYPLLRLAAPNWQGERLPQADFVGYIRRLEEVLIQTLAAFDIQAERRSGLTGVWVPAVGVSSQPGKIASIGVKVDAKGISRHGFALNVAPQMEYWEGIVACGLDGVRMAAIADLLMPTPPMEQVVQQAAISFGNVFGVELVWKDRLERV
ncbi:MAG TPA: lipoyl(octanoyl) transferase [Anaerolineaceae bacterium]|nr:lipoyl(octanoyl) transferase [Anaerolineaceae bacterium]